MNNLISGTKDFTEERRAKFAEAMAAWFQDSVGLPTEALFYDIAAKALAILQQQTLEAQNKQFTDEVARQKQWAADKGMLYAKDYLEKYGISEQELRTAVDTHLLKSDYPPGRGHSFWNRVIDDRPLTTDERATLANSVMLTANQAAEYLGIERKAFDRLKKKHNLQPFEMRRTRGSEWPFAVFKQSDIDRLKPP